MNKTYLNKSIIKIVNTRRPEIEKHIDNSMNDRLFLLSSYTLYDIIHKL